MMLKKVLLVITGLLTLPLYAGTTTSTIDKILLFEGGNLVYVYPAGGLINPPTCHGSNGQYYSFSMARPMAKEYLSLLMTAQARKASVTLWGKGDCLDQTTSETLNYLSLNE